ncbi:D-alanine aminotransferase [hydrothermal vent metagenome]|uniref:D-alanine aminotransferase n=1 Tax=hydrothermal vent metagenome TaxID=652676 RepID=A0A3B1DG23_9ZZZZ
MSFPILLVMLVYLNGSILPAADARVSVFDRGFLFGDAVYEGIRAFSGWVRHLDDHAKRMQQGLDEAGIRWDAQHLHDLCGPLLDANGLRDAFLYWQVTRGTPKPGQPVRARLAEADIEPTVFGYCVPQPGVDALREPTVCSAVTVPDLRWHRGHIKSTALLANIITAMTATQAGGDEAIMLRDGFVSESCSTNVFAVVRTPEGLELRTPPVEGMSILPGVTRQIILDTCPEAKVAPISAAQLAEAEEVFLTGTLTTVKSVVQLDGHPVGTGTPGPLARRVLDRYTIYLREQIAQHTL